MPDETVGLYIGKFQPFHNGHLYAINSIVSKVDRLIIAIGSSQYSNLAVQPFSATERRHMIERSLAHEGITRYSVHEVTDIHNNERWVDHVTKSVPSFSVVFTNNDHVHHLFTAQGFKVQPTKFLDGISGTLVRQKLANHESDWRSLVPSNVVAIVEGSAYYPLKMG